MADKEKKVKKKKSVKEESAAAAPEPEPAAPEPEPAPVSKPASTKASSRSSSKKAKRSGSTVFSMFSTGQIAEFKEDGILGKADLIKIFDTVGKLVTDKEVDDMLAEATGPINFTQLLSLFANRMSGGATDDDEVVVAAFRAFDEGGVINGEKLRHALMFWGEKFTKKEVDEAFDAMEIDRKGMIDTEALIQMMIGGGDEDA
ncbi:hypothetical protein M8J76_016597 [Diaphorina citri]|nr:hypothetical protein M8J76_005021 [Diaphorina citri]KAI5714413.1 hypothetical protein M8J76_016597 [Diaphorina citri]